jgi:hypothetical protein
MKLRNTAAVLPPPSLPKKVQLTAAPDGLFVSTSEAASIAVAIIKSEE